MEHEALTELVAGHAARTHVAGAVVGVLEGQDMTFGCHGVSDLESGTPVEPSTRFAIASITKPMVATAIARLTQTGAVELDDPVGTHVPEADGTEWGSRATIRQLLANTSGLTLRVDREFAFPGSGDGRDALAELTASVAQDPAVAEPGTAWSYGNTGWGVLGRVIECVTGEPWEDAMRRLVFDPLGFESTDFLDRGGDRATNYYFGEEGHTPAPEWNLRGCAPGGAGLLSSGVDLLRFARAHLDDPALVMLRDEHADVRFPWFLDAWCLGWARFDWDGATGWGWDGITQGARAILRLIPARDAAVVLLSNTDTGRALYRAVLPDILRAEFGVTMAPPPTTGSAPDLDRYVGTYTWPERKLTVEVSGQELVVHDSLGSGPVTARPLDERNFLVDPDHPDGDTYSFSCFDDDGRPQMAHRLVWGFPRTDG